MFQTWVFNELNSVRSKNTIGEAVQIQRSVQLHIEEIFLYKLQKYHQKANSRSVIFTASNETRMTLRQSLVFCFFFADVVACFGKSKFDPSYLRTQVFFYRSGCFIGSTARFFSSKKFQKF